MREIVSPLDGFLSPFGRISGSGGGGADAFSIGGASPELVAAFTVASDGTTAGEYFRKAGSETTFGDLFTFSRSGTATYFDASGVLQTAADGVARRNAHYYDSAWVNGGLQLEAAAATQLLHGTDSFATQTETVTAQAYTLQFRGTGSIALTGAHTATLNGTGANDLVSLTFTPSAGTLTLTPSGTVDYPQLEVGSIPTSYIPNTAGSGTVARAAEVLTRKGAASAFGATEMTCAWDTLLTYDGNGPLMPDITKSANEYFRVYVRNAASTYSQYRGDGGPPDYSATVSAAQGGTVSAGINQTYAGAFGIKASDFAQLTVNGNAGTAVATTTIENFDGLDMTMLKTEGGVFLRTYREWSTKLPEADLITAGTAA